MQPSLTLTVEAVESGSAGVTVVTGETRFTDAGPSAGVRPAGVIHGTSCTALTVCTQSAHTQVVYLHRYLTSDRNDNRDSTST